MFQFRSDCSRREVQCYRHMIRDSDDMFIISAGLDRTVL
jgi:hypothetical protein